HGSLNLRTERLVPLRQLLPLLRIIFHMGVNAVTPGVVTFEDARHIVERHALAAAPGTPETIGLLSAAGRVLAEAIIADRDFPPFPPATRDGYAVRSKDVTLVPAPLLVVGEIKAGDVTANSAVQPGEAVSIMTGAPLPQGTDAVVMIEQTSQKG